MGLSCTPSFKIKSRIMHRTVKSHLLEFIGEFGDCIGGAMLGYAAAKNTHPDGLYISLGGFLIILSIVIRKYKA